MISDFTKTTNVAANGDSSSSAHRPSSSSNGFSTSTTRPNSNRRALYAVLTAKCARETCVLRNFQLLGHFPQRGTISGSVFTSDSDFLSALGHLLDYLDVEAEKILSFIQYFMDNYQLPMLLK